MSAYITMLTPMTERESLVDALVDVGFAREHIELHTSAVQLEGIGGGARAQTGNVIIRRQHVGSASNDIGFFETPTGYEVHISDFDQSRYGRAWLAELHARYTARWEQKRARLAAEERRRVEEARRQLVERQREAVYARAKKLGYQIKESRAGETVQLVLVRRTY